MVSEVVLMSLIDSFSIALVFDRVLDGPFEGAKVNNITRVVYHPGRD